MALILISMPTIPTVFCVIPFQKVSDEEDEITDDENYTPYIPVKQRKKMQVDIKY